jgi:hypothetical protein
MIKILQRKEKEIEELKQQIQKLKEVEQEGERHCHSLYKQEFSD